MLEICISLVLITFMILVFREREYRYDQSQKVQKQLAEVYTSLEQIQSLVGSHEATIKSEYSYLAALDTKHDQLRQDVKTLDDALVEFKRDSYLRADRQASLIEGATNDIVYLNKEMNDAQERVKRLEAKVAFTNRV